MTSIEVRLGRFIGAVLAEVLAHKGVQAAIVSMFRDSLVLGKKDEEVQAANADLVNAPRFDPSRVSEN